MIARYASVLMIGVMLGLVLGHYYDPDKATGPKPAPAAVKSAAIPVQVYCPGGMFPGLYDDSVQNQILALTDSYGRRVYNHEKCAWVPRATSTGE